MTEKDNSSNEEIPTLIFNLNDFLQSKEAESEIGRASCRERV